MAVTAPSADTYGAQIDAQIAVLQALVNANKNPAIEYRLQQELNRWQVLAVDHYMVTGWLNAGSNILAAYSAPKWDAVGQALTARVAYLQNLYNNAPAPLPGNANGYGSSGWVTVAQNYLQQLYAAQVSLVEHIMDLPGGTSAATMLANLTGAQTDPAGIPYAYAFSSVGFTDMDEDD
jgi:hypothetical protein